MLLSSPPRPASAADMRSRLLAFAAEMPKIELHVHLEGAIAPATVLALARRHGRSLPAQDEAGLRAWYRFRDFRHFVEVYLTISELLRTAEDFELIVYAFGQEMAQQHIRYAEVTFTPYTHLWQNKGLHPDDLINGLEAGRARARRDFGVEMAWVFDIPRNLSFSNGVYTGRATDPTVEMAIAYRDRGVVALGLGGNEVGAPPEPFAPAFAAARAAGLHSVPHAGETAGPESVWGALRALGADRIGHGVRSVEDPELLTYLAVRRIPLEVNLTSNICLGIYPDYTSHPLPRLLAAGVVVTINSDDPPLFGTTLTREYQLLGEHLGLTATELEGLLMNALAASFLPPARKAALAAELSAECARLRQQYGLEA